MATKSLEDVKKVDQRSTYCVFGYIRRMQSLFPSENIYYTIPALVIHWCLLYYFVDEQFGEDNLGMGYKLSKNNKIMKLIKNKFGAVYLRHTVKTGIHRWKFKILKVNDHHYYMSIGIFKTKNKVKAGCRVDKFRADDGYGWIINCQRTTTIKGSRDAGRGRRMPRRARYGIRDCITGDIIEMILDLNQGNLSYVVNGEDWGVAFANIEITSYRAAVSANRTDDGMELISYQQID